MKLYYFPGSCSLSPHIVLREADYEFEMEKVDPRTGKTESGADYRDLHEKAYVPMLELRNGERLTEGAVIVQYLADQRPESQLAPKAGTFDRVRLNEWLNYIATELHKSFGPFFYGLNEEALQHFRKKLERQFQYLAGSLQDTPYLTGGRFTIADAYLFTVLNWTRPLKMDLLPWPVLGAYLNRIGSRPKVLEAMKAEGLVG